MKTKLFLIVLFLIPFSVFSQDTASKELYLVEKGPRMNGPEVILLQKYLLYKGFDIGKDGIDGWFGTDTDTALRQYQKANGKKVTGKIRVADIPKTLEWIPVVKKYNSKANPAQTTKPPKDIKEGILKTYFGSKQIVFSYYDIRYENLLLSPDGRFLYYEGYSVEYSDPRDGNSHFIYDLLTGDEYVFSALSSLYDIDSSEYEAAYNKCSSSLVSIVYWTIDGDLYFQAQAIFESQPDQKESFILQVQ